MILQQKLLKFFFIFLLLGGCKEKYDPPAVTTDINLLVVDGFINNSADTTFIRLSRTDKIKDGPDNTGVGGAQLAIEDGSGNTVYNFLETSGGNYIIPGLSLDVNSIYRLRINTSDGKQYVTNDLPVKNTPPIDSISWQKEDKGVRIFANTHDPSNTTLYYRWEYVETWNYFSNYFTSVKYENGQLADRAPDDNPYQCWTTLSSKELLLGSSAKLSADVISGAPLRFISLNDVQLSAMYTIFVRQYALTKEAFDYYEGLKKISEQLGSIFDAQPSQISGNLHNVNDGSEAVIGFVTISTLQTKRIFITKQQVDPWDFEFFCAPKVYIPIDSFNFYLASGGLIPTDKVRGPPSGGTIGAHAGQAECVDCRTRGGSTIKPDFWP